MHNRIAVVGLSGSGKSTFTNKLGKKLNRPVIHLDREHWTGDWEKKFTSFEDWKKFQEELVKQNQWIVDGDYSNSRSIRLDRADTIIFFDFPKRVCLWRVFKRAFNKEKPFDKPEGMREQVSWELIKHILKYPRSKHRKIVQSYQDKVHFFTVKNSREVGQLLNTLN